MGGLVGHPDLNNIHGQLVGHAGRMQVTAADGELAHDLGGPGSAPAVAALSQP